jgi:hypothetical protein
MLDARCVVIITADGVWRGDKIIHLKEIADKVPTLFVLYPNISWIILIPIWLSYII